MADLNRFGGFLTNVLKGINPNPDKPELNIED
jgi:hypothetical protein